MMKNIYIIGAHSRAQTLGVYLTKLYPDINIAAYLFDNDEANPENIDSIPVYYFDENTDLNTEYSAYLGTRGIYHQALTEKLRKMGMKDIIPVTSELDRKLRNEFLKQYYREHNKSFDKLEDLDSNFSTCLYVVKSVFDKPLQQMYGLKPYERELQVGAELTGERICDFTDNTGDNISCKNRQFCELTGLYWIWKNARESIIGMEHYRRHFFLPMNWQDIILVHNIDVILPTPLYVSPSVAENYMNRHTVSDWKFMLDYLKNVCAQDYEDAVKFFDHNLYSPCNMFIMKKKALDDLCTWMFPILFACAEHGGEKEDAYQNRYPGFLAERLMSFFFERNRDKYKVVYADKNFLA